MGCVFSNGHVRFFSLLGTWSFWRWYNCFVPLSMFCYHASGFMFGTSSGHSIVYFFCTKIPLLATANSMLDVDADGFLIFLRALDS